MGKQQEDVKPKVTGLNENEENKQKLLVRYIKEKS